MSDMRTRLVNRFRGIATERLERINNTFVALQSSPEDAEQAKFLKREIHTIKGEARMTGFRTLSEVAHRVEELMIGIGDEPLLQNRVDLLFSGFDLMGVLAQESPEVTAEDPRVAAWDEEAVSALGLVTTLPPEGRSHTPKPAGRGGNDPAPPRSTPRPAPGRTPAPMPGRVVAASSYSPPVEPSASAAVSPEPAPAASPPSEGPVPVVTRVGQDVMLRVSLNKLDRVTRVSGDLSLDHLRGERSLDGMLRLISRIGKLQSESHSSLMRMGSGQAIDAYAIQARLQELRDHSDEQRELFTELEKTAKRADDDDFDLGLKLLELDERVRELRFLPLSALFARFPRAVHDIAREQKKQVDLNISGGAIELDKQVLDRISDPLLHLVRNAVDHGIESPEERVRNGKPARASVELIARTLGTAVEIIVRDDGHGVDAEKVRAQLVSSGIMSKKKAAVLRRDQVLEHIFDSGLSTRDKVSELSGRGVGLAVVKDTVEQLGGTAVVLSEMGRWTQFKLRVPTTVVLAKVLLVGVGGRSFAFPAEQVRFTLATTEDQFELVGDTQMLRWGNVRFPVVELAGVLGIALPAETTKRLPMVVVEHRNKLVGLVVSSFQGQHQAVQRPLDAFVSGLRLFHGTIGTPDGDLALLLSVQEVVRRATTGAQVAERIDADGTATGRPRVLVVDDSEFTRDLVVQVLEDMELDITEAVNGRQGLDRFRDGVPDLVLTDLDMPVMDGFELVKRIRARADGGRVPIVVFSTRGSADDKERAAALGADAYVVKTEFREAALKDLVWQLIEEPR